MNDIQNNYNLKNKELEIKFQKQSYKSKEILEKMDNDLKEKQLNHEREKDKR